MLRATVVVALCALPCTAALNAQSGCAPEDGAAAPGPPGAMPAVAPGAALGIRYRFLSGDFRTDPSGTRWIHFLTEPTVTEVYTDGPSDDRLRVGDVIESIDGALITTVEGSRRFAAAGAPGAGATALGVRRDGRALVVEVPPCREPSDRSRARPRTERGAAAGAAPPTDASAGSGMRLRCRECGYRDGRWRFAGAPVVTAVLPAGPAARSGLRVGDALLEIDGLRLGEPAGDRRFSELAAGDTARWTIRRGGDVLELEWIVAR